MKALSCPACGAPVQLRAAGYTVSVACAHCGSTLDALAPDLALIEKADAVARKPRIAVGARAQINGIAWDAIGYMERSAGSSRWSEYLLFNPYYGYRFLIDDGRCWSVGRLLDGEPKLVGYKQRRLGEAVFDRFEDPYDATVRFVLGEFYWRVTAGETVRVTDYVLPGVMLSQEEAEDEVTWTRTDLLDRGVVEKAFGIPEKINLIQRPSPHERSPWTPLLMPLWITAAVAGAALIGLTSMQPPHLDLGGRSMQTRLDMPEQTTSIGAYQLPRDYNRVVVRAWGDGLDNEWIDADLSLVNEQTQQSYDGYALAEHYSGYDSDGAWSEGASVTNVVFSHIPKGRYDLVVDYSAHTWSNYQAPSSWMASTAAPVLNDRPSPPLGIDLQVGGMEQWNFGLALLALLVPPAAVTYAQYMFDRRRRGLS